MERRCPQNSERFNVLFYFVFFLIFFVSIVILKHYPINRNTALTLSAVFSQ